MARRRYGYRDHPLHVDRSSDVPHFPLAVHVSASRHILCKAVSATRFAKTLFIGRVPVAVKPANNPDFRKSRF